MTTKTNFEFFVNTQAPKNNSAPMITVRRKGVLVLTKKAADMLGENVTHVQIAYDAKTRSVAVCKAESDSKGRYTMRDMKNDTFLVNAKPMFAHYGLNVERAQSYDVKEFDKGLIGVSLPDDVASPA